MIPSISARSSNAGAHRSRRARGTLARRGLAPVSRGAARLARGDVRLLVRAAFGRMAFHRAGKSAVFQPCRVADELACLSRLRRGGGTRDAGAAFSAAFAAGARDRRRLSPARGELRAAAPDRAPADALRQPLRELSRCLWV